MNAQIRSELLKLRTTRTTIELLAWMALLVGFVVLLHVFTLRADTLSDRDGQLKVFGWGTSVGALFASLLGASSVTGEIRHGTIRPTFLATPKRARVLAAKAAVSALAGLALGLLAEALAVGSGSAGLAARGIATELSDSDYLQILAGGAIGAALWGTIGVGVGSISRNQTGTLVGLCVWLLLVETTLIGNIPSIGKFTPGASAGALAGAIQTQAASSLLAPAVAALLLATYAAAAVLAGSIAIACHDVS